MPTYTYRCQECGHQFEKRQRMSDAPLSKCPACGGSVRRVVNSVGIVFKGSGFYVTDNRNGNSANGSTSSTSQLTDKHEDKSSVESSKGAESAKTEKKKPKEPAQSTH